MSEYSKPKLFKPSLEEQREVAKELAGLFSPKVGVKLTDGTVVPGERGKLKKCK
ncbi:MAG: hypothetical protein AAF693_19265 [Bacteroidota bacterium]